MAHVCPWWFVRSFDNPLRRVFHEPGRIFGPWVRPGMQVLDVGCGAGFNTEGLARLVGPSGRVVAVDLQARMLAMTARRLVRTGLSERAELVQSREDELGLGSKEQFDFAVAFWMVHEVRDANRLFQQLHRLLKPGASLLICEPKLHVSEREFDNSVRAALRAGFRQSDRPRIALSRSASFTRPVLEDGSDRSNASSRLK